jgi:parallel beta-helix repeat protein
LLGDSIHLATTSPCRNAGLTNIVSSVDIDGDPWATPPSMGCDEWQPTPQIVVQPRPKFNNPPRNIVFDVMSVAGQQSFSCFWFKDGLLLADSDKYSSTRASNFAISNFDASDAGSYQVVISNAFGVTTSLLAQVVIHCVDAAGTGPIAPYSTWATAATHIQDAIDAASAGDCVWVTNGIYSSGGKVMTADLTNRVAVDKPLTLMSINGYSATVIRGAWDPVTTTGPGAVRSVWLTTGAILNGFTVQGGATRATGTELDGGGIWCAPALLAYALQSATVVNCLIINNAASGYGGGTYLGAETNCIIKGNRATYGGGMFYPYLANCSIQENLASLDGGGVYEANVVNCTIVGNSALRTGGGVYTYPSEAPMIRNSIVFFNSASSYADVRQSYPGFAGYCCSSTSLLGTGNITTDPQLVDAMHLSVVSPCRGTGYLSYASGTDIDGDPWANPPSMGCDEVVESALVGPLSISAQASQTQMLVNRAVTLTGTITGRASRLEWSFGDGPIATNLSFITTHAWTNAGDYTVTCTAYNNDNPLGMSANVLVHVLPLTQPLLEASCLATNGFQFQFGGQSNATYLLQMATNLTPPVVWQTLQTLNSTGGVVQITDPSPTNSAQFYRIQAQ